MTFTMGFRAACSCRLDGLFLRRLTRHLCTTACWPVPSHPSPSSLPAFMKPPSGVSIDREVKRLTRARRFSDVEALLESRKSNPPEEASARELHFASVIASYGYARMVDAAERTFEQMSGPRTAVSLNALLATYEHSRDHVARVPDIFAELPAKHGIQVNAASYGILINVMCELGRPEHAYEVVVKELEQKGLEVTTVTYTPIVDAFYKKGKPEEADKVWKEMIDKGCVPDLTAYNVRAKNVSHHGTPEEMAGVIGEIESAGLVPDMFTHNMIIRCYCRNAMLQDAMVLYRGLRLKKLRPNRVTFAILTVFLIKEKDFGSALQVCLDGLGKGVVPDYGSAKHLLEGLVKDKKVEDAKMLVGELMEKGSPRFQDMLKELEEKLLGAEAGGPAVET